MNMAIPKRKSRNLSENKEIYIFTEGTETERHYFEGLKQVLKIQTIKIVVKGTGESGVRLITYAASYTKSKSAEVWVVFDKDDLRESDIENSKRIADRHKINIAFSNSCFEVWLLMHYERIFFPSGLDKKLVYEKLTKHTGVKNYIKNKNNIMLMRKIAEKYIIALENNKLLMKQSTSFLNVPFTNMIDLIDSIKKK